jgi:cobalt-zinc-cadmium efflux system membrane fusion protein
MRNIFLWGALIVVLQSCTSQASQSNTAGAPARDENQVILDSAQKKNAGVVIGGAAVQNLHTVIKASGTVDVPPRNLVTVSFPLGGYLKNTNLLPGMPIRKGQVIALMEDQSYVQLEQDYLTARAKMQYLVTDLQRQKELSDADASSKKSYQLVQSDYSIQQASVRSIAEKLRIIHINPDKLDVNGISGTVPIYSPIDGYVSKVNVNIGKYVNPTDVLFELVNPDDLHAAITVFEKDITLFKKGLHGRVSLVDNPGKWYDVETILVSRNVSDSRTGMVHCHFEKPGRELLPGMFLTAEFELDSKPGTVVPEEAVVRYMGKEFVFVTPDEKSFRLTEVNTGTKENGLVQLEPGAVDWLRTRIVVSGTYALLGKLKNKMED